MSLDYLPNEVGFNPEFKNEDMELILNGPECDNKFMLFDFFRGVLLCSQAAVIKEDGERIKYSGVHIDELRSLEFANQMEFTLTSRQKKIVSIMLKGRMEKFEELGIVTTKAPSGHFLTICAVRTYGLQEGVLYMKGSIATLKSYFLNKETDFQYLNQFEQKFVDAGLNAVVYAKRQLSSEETSQLIITINEGVQHTKQNQKLDNLLYNLSSVQLEILGVLGLQRAIHMRNRVVIDELVANGIKPWIISKEVEQTHMTCLNSLRMF